jgi:SHS2 domain-containing protein
VTYRFLPHTADIRATIDAPTFRRLLEDLVQVLRELVAGDPPVEPRSGRLIAIEAPDAPELILRLSREVLDAFQIDGFVPARLEVDTLSPPPKPPALRGRIVGEPFDPARHDVRPEVKAVTRHGLLAEPTARGWHAELLFDV